MRSLRALAGGVVGVRDGAAVLRLLRGSGDETTAAEALRRAGVSRATVERFFAPFLRGIFLEERLDDVEPVPRLRAPVVLRRAGGAAARTAWARSRRSSRKGSTSAPAPPSPRSGPHAVSLESGEQLRADAVVVATAGIVDEPAHGWNGVTCVYYDAPATPIPGPWLVVNGEGGPINNLCVPSEVAPSYAPAGRALVSLTILGAGEPDLDAVDRQLRGWFGIGGGGVAPPADVPDPSGAARLSGRRLVRAAGAARRRACTPAATTASTRRSTARSPRAAGRRKPCSPTALAP